MGSTVQITQVFFCSHSVTEVGIVFSLHFFATISTIHIDFVWFSNHVLNRQIFSWHCSKRRVESACVWGLPKMEMMLETPPPIGPQKKQSNFLQLSSTLTESKLVPRADPSYIKKNPWNTCWAMGPLFLNSGRETHQAQKQLLPINKFQVRMVI